MSEVKIEVAELRGLLEKATTGPWNADLRRCVIIAADAHSGSVAVVHSGADDAALIAAMKRALPSLLDRLEQAEREVERLTGFSAQSVQNAMQAGTGSLMPSVHGSFGGGFEAINTQDPNRALKQVASEYRARAEASEALVARLRGALETLAEYRRRVRNNLGEAVHTGLRKGVDGLGSHRAWTAINDMEGDGWSQAIQFAAEGLEYGLEQRLRAAEILLSEAPRQALQGE